MDDCEKLSKAEMLDSQCSQVTPWDERELEVIIDLVSLGDGVLEGRVLDGGWGVGRLFLVLSAGLGWEDLKLVLEADIWWWT